MMAPLAATATLFPCKCSIGREPDASLPLKPNKNMVKINGNSATRVEVATAVASMTPPIGMRGVDEELAVLPKSFRQNIPTKKQTTDSYRQGVLILGGVGYRQTVVIRSYEVGADKTATLDTFLNLFQETALNHVWMSGLLGDGFGATHGMIKNNLIWVVSRMQVQVDSYPICTWVMMNQNTRRLSKMPEEVRAEISPWFIDKKAIKEDVTDKIIKLNDAATYINSGLKPKRSDLDMNNHVNNVKYVGWMLETIPESFLETHQLSSIVLEYRRECGSSDVVESRCEPDENPKPEGESVDLFGGYPLAPQILEGHGILGPFHAWPLSYTHLLQIKGETKNEEIVRGRTTWRKKFSIIPFSS
ncbi:palmitoyl-acyl carrier protein thioesterase, chloroplastic isoform X2 [Amborella trichopoda]|uniref:palmitoyl-acyl carrier protein thioesterase, chloroplastic isoform X2 n=1 Tax=Amborella trichopoda TaxID=13333 RepID=UPI0009BEB5F1|nr:palmitoyl-acyl carrier protein thioesterase, chloroplastic isoform X2 [Amborella trichopoda]|eukprot:XP_020522790.1 palmitoyl-acyl carrier protein thioesterase, chloroplastic isoform X2 [Amborella trichopoda]